MPLNDALVRRFHKVLVEEIRSGSPDYLADSFTVAEIYQSLVPYRTHRDRIGVELNGDYEAILLRLLGGEGDYLELQSEAARARIQRELKSSNPNTGIYREFAAVEVQLNSDRLPEPDLEVRTGAKEPKSSESEGDTGDQETAGDSKETKGATGAGAGKDDPSESGPTDGKAGGSAVAKPSDRLQLHTGGSGSSSSKSAGKSAGSREPKGATGTKGATATSRRARGAPPSECPDCESALPDRETLRFCPFCGTNVFIMPCGDCGEVLERSWLYCVACGTPTEE